MAIQHYVKIYYPGSFVSDACAKKVSHRSPEKMKKELEKEKYAYCFYFFDQEEKEIDGEMLEGKPKNKSPEYYIDGIIYTLDEIKKHYPEKRTLIWNMEHNKIPKVVKTKFGQFISVRENAIEL